MADILDPDRGSGMEGGEARAQPISDPHLEAMGDLFVRLKKRCPDVKFTFEDFLRRPGDFMRIVYHKGEVCHDVASHHTSNMKPTDF